MLRIQTCAYSDAGDVKAINQDSVLIRSGVLSGHAVSLCIVADGCGGMAFGEEISRLIVTSFSRFWEKDLPRAVENSVSDAVMDALLEQTITDINNVSVDFGKQANAKVGSTLSLLLTIDERFYIKNIGDSRVYRRRDDRLQQMTEDQSLVAELVRRGTITKKEMKTYPKKNVLTMCIGTFDKVYTFSRKGKIQPGDEFLLCCDGMHNTLTEKQMLSILRSRRIPFAQKAEALRREIRQGEATDNVSAVICRFSRGLKEKRLVAILAVAAILALAVLWLSEFGILPFSREPEASRATETSAAVSQETTGKAAPPGQTEPGS